MGERKKSFMQKARRQSKIIKNMFGGGGGADAGAVNEALPDTKEEEEEEEGGRGRGSTTMSMSTHIMGDVLSRHREGWMNKKGGSRRNWKRRWFVLQV
jgi:hypothetical protein